MQGQIDSPDAVPVKQVFVRLRDTNENALDTDAIRREVTLVLDHIAGVNIQTIADEYDVGGRPGDVRLRG